MGFKKALVAYDGSGHAKHALATALEMVADTFVRDLVVLYVSEMEADTLLDSASLAKGLPAIMITEPDHDTLSNDLMEQVRGFEEAVELVIIVGVPKNDIIRIAEQKECDLIIMGSRGMGAIRSILGSVSYAVIRDAEMPVLIVK